MNILFSSNPCKPKKIYLIHMIAEGMDFSIVTRAFRFKTEAKNYCDYYNKICEDRCYTFEETMLYE